MSNKSWQVHITDKEMMKKILIVFLMSLMIHNVSAQIPDKCSDIDSIYVLSIEFDLDFASTLTRERFKESFYNEGKYDLVRDRDKINEICKLLTDLIPISIDSISCDCNKQRIIIDKRGIPRFIEWDKLDVRTLLVLHMQNSKQALIWISRSSIEIDCKLYHISDSLYSYIYNYKYSHIIKTNKQ